jgi:hypothetical protein
VLVAAAEKRSEATMMTPTWLFTAPSTFSNTLRRTIKEIAKIVAELGRPGSE